jgi:hypothetical protein
MPLPDAMRYTVFRPLAGTGECDLTNWKRRDLVTLLGGVVAAPWPPLAKVYLLAGAPTVSATWAFR